MADVGGIRRDRRTLAAGAFGNVLEWYDYSLYAFFAATIGRHFFPQANELDSLIAVFGVFAAGYLMRPLGGLLFGYIGDTYGRKPALILSTVAMGLPTAAIGLLPTAAQIGTLAAVLLVVFRLLQGLSIGGEYPGSVVYLVERAHPDRRGLSGVLAILGAGIGTLAGSGTALVVSSVMSSEAVESWGWRLPFLGGILIAAVGLYLRRRLPETRDADAGGRDPIRLIRELRAQWLTIPKIAGLNLMHAVGLFAMFIYMKTYLQVQVGIGRAEALQVSTIGFIVLIPLTAWFAALSDRVGRKPVLIVSALAAIVFAYPLLSLMNDPSFGVLVAGQIGFAVIIGGYAGAAPTTMAEMLPGHTRVSGTALGYNLCMALFGGTTPLVVIYLMKVSGNDLAPAFYLMAASAVSLAVVSGLKETAKRPLAT